MALKVNQFELIGFAHLACINLLIHHFCLRCSIFKEHGVLDEPRFEHAMDGLVFEHPPSPISDSFYIISCFIHIVN